jgi:hypothetical protein
MPSDAYLRTTRTHWLDEDLKGYTYDGRSDGMVPVLFFEKPYAGGPNSRWLPRTDPLPCPCGSEKCPENS